MPYSNEQIGKVFERLADLSELKGESVFKVRAYQRAARTIEHFPEPLESWVRQSKDLKVIEGIGDAIAKKISDLVNTGVVKEYEELKALFPEGVIEIMDVPGVGPKTAARLVNELGVRSVDDLVVAINAGKFATMPRMGPKTAENILRHIESFKNRGKRIRIDRALHAAELVVASLKERCPELQEVVATGSIRRWQETIGDIDIIAVTRDGGKVLDAFASLPIVVDVLGKGPKKSSVIVSSGLQIDLRVIEPEEFGAMLQYFTGSKEHNVQLREYAKRLGLSLNEYGLKEEATGTVERFATEEAFYQRLGMPVMPPEIRQGTREIEAALQGRLPKLVEVGDLKGDLHMHSDWSDGRDSIEQMLTAAKAKGYEYVALTDHSVGRGIANGLSWDRFQEQRRLVRALEQRLGIKVLHGSEVDIRADGSLDYPDELAEQLDIVVASVHSGMGQSRDVITARVLKAIRNPHVDVIGHLSTRLIQERDAIDLDFEAVFRAAAETGVALEINASPERLDLKDVHAYRARELGVPLVIDSDAHKVEGLDVMRFGVSVARRAWCEAGDVYNTRPVGEFLAWLNRKRV
ncbi:MAG: DNA polymerase/3'-5' exonuclease PolX [Dehalococcoidia bacterium]|nr:DNA polymerase/3'-5' exonuclease PolX [Dehalococcoidia bacterium]